jgi:hypothetical protein
VCAVCKETSYINIKLYCFEIPLKDVKTFQSQLLRGKKTLALANESKKQLQSKQINSENCKFLCIFIFLFTKCLSTLKVLSRNEHKCIFSCLKISIQKLVFVPSFRMLPNSCCFNLNGPNKKSSVNLNEINRLSALKIISCF